MIYPVDFEQPGPGVYEGGRGKTSDGPFSSAFPKELYSG